MGAKTWWAASPWLRAALRTVSPAAPRTKPPAAPRAVPPSALGTAPALVRQTARAGVLRVVLPAVLLAAALLAAGLAGGCGLLFPARFTRAVELLPLAQQAEGTYEVRDNRVAWVSEGLRVEVEHVTDRKLNEQYGDESAQGLQSTNPYTYGDWVDPATGYVPDRFTVFRVTVKNLSLAKVELDPSGCRLVGEPGGQVLEAYGLEAGSAARNLEDYYRARRGPTGNDEFTFSTRMANLRASLFLKGERIYRGESYSGYVVFDPLADGTAAATLAVPGFVVRFSAYDKPLETVDLAFRFRRQVAMGAYTAAAAGGVDRAATTARLSEASRVTGQQTGDLTRQVETIDAYVRTRLADVDRCFSGAYAAGTVAAGHVAVRYVILPGGGVESAEVVQSSLGNAAVEACVAAQLGKWRFSPSGGAQAGWGMADTTGAGPRQTEAAAPAPAVSGPVVVVSTLEFGEGQSGQ